MFERKIEECIDSHNISELSNQSYQIKRNVYKQKHVYVEQSLCSSDIFVLRITFLRTDHKNIYSSPKSDKEQRGAAQRWRRETRIFANAINYTRRHRATARKRQQCVCELLVCDYYFCFQISLFFAYIQSKKITVKRVKKKLIYKHKERKEKKRRRRRINSN